MSCWCENMNFNWAASILEKHYNILQLSNLFITHGVSIATPWSNYIKLLHREIPPHFFQASPLARISRKCPTKGKEDGKLGKQEGIVKDNLAPSAKRSRNKRGPTSVSTTHMTWLLTYRRITMDNWLIEMTLNIYVHTCTRMNTIEIML